MNSDSQDAASTSDFTRRGFLNTTGTAALGVCMGGFSHAAGSPDHTEKDDMITTGWVSDERYLGHQQSGNHPESPERLRAIFQQMKRSGLDKKLRSFAPLVDPDLYIRMIHSEAHIDQVARQAHDDAICRLAVSGTLTAVDAVCSGKVRNAFCAVRPPGHHAANNGEFGFCFYNNVAIAARYAQKQHKLAKVLIVDWDYHHGDGTEWAFYEDPTVMCFSTHALYAFPRSGAADKTGSGRGEGYNINVPLPRGADDTAIVNAFNKQLLPAAENFEPDLVLISAGFDARKEDPLGDFSISDEGFAKLTKLVMTIAEKHANSRIVSILEGGYNTQGLALAVESHVRTLLDA